MDPSYRHRQIEGAPGRQGCLWYLIAAIVVFVAARWLCSFTIDYQWWQEMGQLHTWFSILTYSLIPASAATVLGFVVFWITHARAMKHARTSLGQHPLYAKLATLAVFLLAWIIATSTLDTWTVVRYFGGRNLGGAATSWRDPVFNNPLSFYLFKVPFYSDLLGLLLSIVFVAAVIYWITARGWQLRDRIGDFRNVQEINLSEFRLAGALESKFLRGMGAVFLLALAVRFFLGRYGMLLNEHGSFMVGVDYVDQNISLPLQWLVIATCVVAAGLLAAARWKTALIALVGAILVRNIIPPIVATVYVLLTVLSWFGVG